MNTKLTLPQWQTSVANPRFGIGQTFTVIGPDDKPLYDAFVRYETPGEANIVIRESDGAIAFVMKYRPHVLPKTEENIAWRNAGNLDILNAPSVGMESLEITRGWVYDSKKPWKIMTEGQEETGLIVEGIKSLPHFYANTGIDASWIDLSFGFATDRPYGESVDKIEQVEIKKVIWLTPSQVKRYMLMGNCGASKAALSTFRAFALESKEQFLLELGQKL